MHLFVAVYIQFFFLLTPFFVLSVFLALTRGMTASAQRRTAVRTTGAVLVVCSMIFFFGRPIFNVLGITLDAFRVGAGALLFLSAVSLVKGKAGPNPDDVDGDVSVVPLAIPVTVGPATIGAIMVLGSELTGRNQLIGIAALIAAGLSVGFILFISRALERILGGMALTILMKLTGLILAALSAQLVFTGIRNLMNG